MLKVMLCAGCKFSELMVVAKLEEGKRSHWRSDSQEDPYFEITQKQPREVPKNKINQSLNGAETEMIYHSSHPLQSLDLDRSYYGNGWSNDLPHEILQPNSTFSTQAIEGIAFIPQQPSPFFCPSGSPEWTAKSKNQALAAVRECNGLFVNPAFCHLQFRSDGSVIDQTGNLYTPLDYVPGTGGPTLSVKADPLSKEKLEALASTALKRDSKEETQTLSNSMLEFQMPPTSSYTMTSLNLPMYNLDGQHQPQNQSVVNCVGVQNFGVSQSAFYDQKLPFISGTKIHGDL